MAASPKVSIALVVAVAAIATSARARAQSNAPAVVPVEISATQRGAYIQLRGANGQIPCGERCALQLPQGQYRVVVSDREGYVSAQKVTLLLPGRIIVSPANRGDKVLGIGLFAGGIVATAAGTITLYFAMLNDGFAGSRPCGTECVPSWAGYAGGISLGVGLAAVAAGIFLWRTNVHAVISTRPPGAPPSPPAAWPPTVLRLTPAAGPQWAGLALTGRL